MNDMNSLDMLNKEDKDELLNGFLEAKQNMDEILKKGGEASKRERLEAMRNLTFAKAAVNNRWLGEEREARKEKFYKEYSQDNMMKLRISELSKAFASYESTGRIPA